MAKQLLSPRFRCKTYQSRSGVAQLLAVAVCCFELMYIIIAGQETAACTHLHSMLLVWGSVHRNGHEMVQ